MKETTDLTGLKWFHQPQLSVLSEKKLIIETEPNTEMVSFDNADNTAFGVISASLPGFRLALKMEYRFEHPGDECGVLIRMDDEHWLRFGIVLRDEEISEIFCTRYDSGKTDRSVREVGSGIIQLYLHAEYTPGKVVLSYSMNDYRYSAFREMTFEDVWNSACLGLYAGSKGDSSFDATFSHVEIDEIQ